jgi:hypothetical protein
VSDTPDDQDRPTAIPFLTALVIIVVVITAIFVINIGSGDSDPEQIGRAVVAQNDALQRQNYHDFVASTCAAQHGTEDKVLARQRDSAAARGERYVDGASNVVVDGDRATADVRYHFGENKETEESAEMSFVREDGAWTVCSVGPA